MSHHARRPFVAVVATIATAIVAVPDAAANPPAPSSVPDPPKLPAPQAGESPRRVRKHDGGCFAYYDSGGIVKVPCPESIAKEPVGEEIEREPTSGQCIKIEPWEEEPKGIACPAVLVPNAPAASASAPVAPPAPKGKPQLQGQDPTHPNSAGGCGKCSLGAPNDGATVPAIAGLAIAFIATRRRRSQRPERRSLTPGAARR